MIALIVLTSVAGLTLYGVVAAVALISLTRAVEQEARSFNEWVAVDDAPLGGDRFWNDLPAAPRGTPVTPEALQAERGPVVPVRDYALSGPFTHENLAVYFIHGPDTMKGQRVLSLQEALDRNLAVVREGFLTVENRSDAPVFIQAGDIVKGGNQDRVLPSDQLIPPLSQGQPVTTFCVEAGRSGPRGHELSASFQTATEQLPGKRLNLAARYRRSQTEVWDGVRQMQLTLNRRLGGSVQAPQSATSLQLTLESLRVQQGVEAYLNELAPLPEGKANVIGMAVAVNGQIQCAEVYGSSALFRSLWRKLLKANAVAALLEKQAGAEVVTPSQKAVQRFLTETEAGQSCQREQACRTLVLRRDAGASLLFDTCDPDRQNLVVHRSFLAK
jgi:hypothetical protein